MKVKVDIIFTRTELADINKCTKDHILEIWNNYTKYDITQSYRFTIIVIITYYKLIINFDLWEEENYFLIFVDVCCSLKFQLIQKHL